MCRAFCLRRRTKMREYLKTVTVRVTPQEQRRLEEVARQTNRTVSATLRTLVQQCRVAPAPDLILAQPTDPK